MIDIYDDVLEEHNAILVDDMVRQISWKYDYQPTTLLLNKHWIHHPDSWALELFNKFDVVEKYKATVHMVYMLGHTHGMEQQTHTDDGDLTMIYYPDLNWKPEWGGGTMVYNDPTQNIIDDHVTYKGNRLVVFDAWRKHQGQPISKQCHELRKIIVFKCYIDGENKDRLDYYK